LLRGLEDYDLWLRLAAVTDFCYIDEELGLYRQSDTSLSRTRSMLSHWQGMERIFSRAADSIQVKDGGLAMILNQQLAACKRSMCDEYLALRQYRHFAQSFAALCRIRPLAAARYPATMVRHLFKRL
jgi:hypothetical protein